MAGGEKPKAQPWLRWHAERCFAGVKLAACRHPCSGWESWVGGAHWELMGHALTPPIRHSPIGSEGERCSGWINIGAIEKARAIAASAT